MPEEFVRIVSVDQDEQIGTSTELAAKDHHNWRHT